MNLTVKKRRSSMKKIIMFAVMQILVTATCFAAKRIIISGTGNKTPAAVCSETCIGQGFTKGTIPNAGRPAKWQYYCDCE